MGENFLRKVKVDEYANRELDLTFTSIRQVSPFLLIPTANNFSLKANLNSQTEYLFSRLNALFRLDKSIALIIVC